MAPTQQTKIKQDFNIEEIIMEIKVCRPSLGQLELEMLTNCVRTDWISSDGPYVNQFEREFSEYIGVQNGVAVNNGTSALTAAIYAVGIKPGDEVIVPSFTIISCAISIIRVGGTPVFVDIEPDTWNIDVNKIEKCITARTKAIMAVHMYGHPCDMQPIIDIASKYRLKVIEDASQVHGAEYKGVKCGALGDVATFSFYANKIITTGEGGMVVTNSEEISERARSYRNLCFDKERRFIHKDLGDNLRMTNMQAAIGVAQMRRIHDFVRTKRENGRIYADLLSNISGIKLQTEKTWAKMVYWMYCIQIEPRIGISANELRIALKKHGVETRPFFYGLHAQPCLNKYHISSSEFPVTEAATKYGLYLPSGIDLTLDEIRYVANAVKCELEK